MPAFEGVFGVLLQHILYLLLPVDDGGCTRGQIRSWRLTFQDVGLVLAGGAVAVGHVGGRQGQQRGALDLPHRDVGVRQERMEFLHQVLAHQIRQVHLVERVAQDRKEHLLKIQGSVTTEEINALRGI